MPAGSSAEQPAGDGRKSACVCRRPGLVRYGHAAMRVTLSGAWVACVPRLRGNEHLTAKPLAATRPARLQHVPPGSLLHPERPVLRRNHHQQRASDGHGLRCHEPPAAGTLDRRFLPVLACVGRLLRNAMALALQLLAGNAVYQRWQERRGPAVAARPINRVDLDGIFDRNSGLFDRNRWAKVGWSGNPVRPKRAYRHRGLSMREA